MKASAAERESTAAASQVHVRRNLMLEGMCSATFDAYRELLPAASWA